MVQYRFLGLAVVVSLSIAGCMEGNNAISGPRSGANAAAADRDVENPSAFSKRENGLWDGRPSLGGVWVAHPDVTSPERVIIRNTENGEETIGALFRRERLNPGPSFQVSGEAANAVGMLAGAPTMIEVVALRVEEAAPEPAAPETSEPQAVEDSTEQAAATAQERTAQEAATPDSATPDSATPERAAAQPTEEDAEQVGADAIEMPQAQAPRRSGGVFGRIFGRRDTARQADMQPEMIETQVIDDAAALPEAAMSATQQPAAEATAATAPPAPSPLAQPYIQLGIFSVEANARNAERMASGAGLNARVVAGRASGNQFWRVVVGPANTQAEQRQMLARVKGLGFNDAYAVRR